MVATLEPVQQASPGSHCVCWSTEFIPHVAKTLQTSAFKFKNKLLWLPVFAGPHGNSEEVYCSNPETPLCIIQKTNTQTLLSFEARVFEETIP